jgi:hypothetical protein
MTTAPAWWRRAVSIAWSTRSWKRTRLGRPVSASCSAWCSLTTACRVLRWMATIGSASSGSMPTENSPTITMTGARPSAKPAVDICMRKSEAM